MIVIRCYALRGAGGALGRLYSLGTKLRGGAERSFARSCSSTGDSGGGEQDYFALLGVARRFDLDGPALSAAYKARMKDDHPDKWVSASTVEQQAAGARAAAVTHAYATLRRPHQRAAHLLELVGGGLMDAGGEAAAIQMPMEFLMWVMEAREQLEGEDVSEATLGALRAEVQEQVASNAAVLTAAFERVAAGEAAAMEEAQELTAVLQYLRRIQDEIREKSAAV